MGHATAPIGESGRWQSHGRPSPAPVAPRPLATSRSGCRAGGAASATVMPPIVARRSAQRAQRSAAHGAETPGPAGEREATAAVSALVEPRCTRSHRSVVRRRRRRRRPSRQRLHQRRHDRAAVRAWAARQRPRSLPAGPRARPRRPAASARRCPAPREQPGRSSARAGGALRRDARGDDGCLPATQPRDAPREIAGPGRQRRAAPGGRCRAPRSGGLSMVP